MDDSVKQYIIFSFSWEHHGPTCQCNLGCILHLHPCQWTCALLNYLCIYISMKIHILLHLGWILLSVYSHEPFKESSLSVLVYLDVRWNELVNQSNLSWQPDRGSGQEMIYLWAMMICYKYIYCYLPCMSASDATAWFPEDWRTTPCHRKNGTLLAVLHVLASISLALHVTASLRKKTHW